MQIKLKYGQQIFFCGMLQLLYFCLDVFFHPHSPSTHTFLDVPSPRCVGPALTSGAIYLASHHDRIVELICLQGNVGSNQDTENEEDELDGVVMEPPKSSVKRNQSSRVQQNR